MLGINIARKEIKSEDEIVWKRKHKKKGMIVLDLEKDINNWLEEHPSIKIVNIKQSSSGGSLHVTKLFISVWYEEVA